MGEIRLELGNRRWHGGHFGVFGIEPGPELGRINLRIKKIELHIKQTGGQTDHTEMGAHATVDQTLQLAAVGDVDEFAFLVGDQVAVQLAHDGDHRFVTRRDIA